MLTIGLIMAGTSICPSQQALAVEPSTIDKVVDPITNHEYPGSSNSDYTTPRHPGRIWTDKSVLSEKELATESATISQHGTSKPITLAADELVVALSARGSTRHVTGEIQAPIDLVIVLDNSRSMAQCVSSDSYCDNPAGYTQSRAYAMAQAVNTAIGVIAQDNRDNRVGIVEFGTSASTLFALAKPQFVSGSTDYVTLSQPATSGGTMTFKTADASMTIGQVGSVVQSTNIQLGIAVGMGLLADQNPAAVSGAKQRLPNVLIFTDGEPTLSSTTGSWWNIPISSGTHGPATPGGTQYYGNGFKAALTASFLKNKINDVYNDPAYNNTMGMLPVSASVYTVGLGISGLTPDGHNLAVATLDPANQLGQTDNTMNAGFTNAWAAYTASPPNPVPVPVAAGTSFNVTHPAGLNAKYDPALEKHGIKYNDAYYTPITTEDLIEVFHSIAQSIVNTAPNFPVAVEDGSAASSGFVTFTDPLGPYMHVTEITRLTFCPIFEGTSESLSCDLVVFTDPVITDLGGGLTDYTFTGTFFANNVVGLTDVSDLIVTVRQFDSLAQGDVVTMQVPAALLPLRDKRVTVDSAGNPIKMVQYDAHPMHLYYKVAPKPGVLDALSDPSSLQGTSPLEGTALASYIAANTVAGKVRFYSNSYTVEAGGAIRASATVAWQPNERNDYYRFSFDTPLFADEARTIPLTKAAWNSIDPNAAIWYHTVEYIYTDSKMTGIKKINTVHKTTKSMLVDAASFTTSGATIIESDGQMFAQADLLDFARPGLLDHPKCFNLTWSDGNPFCNDPVGPPTPGNLTGTANLVRQLNFRSSDIVTRLGNNGYLAVPIPGLLSVRKLVDAATGLHPRPNTNFTIGAQLLAENGSALSGSFSYTVVNLSDVTTPVRSGQFTSGDLVTLRANQQLNIRGLPEGSTYTVWEQKPLPTGYSLTNSTGLTGTINLGSGQPNLAVLHNTYQPASVTYGQSLPIKKTLNGREWSAVDSFEAIMCPVGGSASLCQTISFERDDTHHGTATMTAPTFTDPGTYVYTIIEADDHRLEGVSYSGAVYQWTVEVTDDGSGSLSATGSLVKLRNDDATSLPTPSGSTTALFTNTFSTENLTGVLTARKMVYDASIDETRTPRGAYTFAFQYLGADLDAPAADHLDSEPSFNGADAQGIVLVTNDASQITSSLITFTADHIGHTFYYRAWEKPGAFVNVKYSDAIWYWRIHDGLTASGAPVPKVTHCLTTKGNESHCHPVTGAANYALVEESNRVFLNEYSPEPAEINLQGTKALDGRAWADGEKYSFTLTANDQTTLDAIEAGDVVVSSTTATTGSDVDKQNRTSFSFGTISLAKQGSYQFRVSEDVPSPIVGGILFDEREIVYEIVVVDVERNGCLSASVSVRDQSADDEIAHFTNRYRTQLDWRLATTITMQGRDMADGEFSFSLVPDDDLSPSRFDLTSDGLVWTNTTSQPNGSTETMKMPRGPQRFTQDDAGQTYCAAASQTVPPEPSKGMSYDSVAYQICVKIEDDGLGKLTVHTTITGSDGSVKTYANSTHDTEWVTPQIDFVNLYESDRPNPPDDPADDADTGGHLVSWPLAGALGVALMIAALGLLWLSYKLNRRKWQQLRQATTLL